MKKFKKLIVPVLAAVMVVCMAGSVFAAASPTSAPKPTSKPKPTTTTAPKRTSPVVVPQKSAATSKAQGGYIIEPLGKNSKRSDSWTDYASAEDQAAIKAGTVEDMIAALASSSAPGKDEISSAAAGMQFLALFFDCYPWGNAAKTNASVKMIVPGIDKYNEADIKVIHYSEARKCFETLSFSKLGNNQLSVTFKDFSPTAILVNDSEPVTPVTVSAATTTTTAAAAPKTGVATLWTVYAAIALILAAAAAVVYRRKNA